MIQEMLEQETKFDVPLSEEPNNIERAINKVLAQEGWNCIRERRDEKDLLYYDTINFDLHKTGKTLRRVTPFDSSKLGTTRYDFKHGKDKTRVERKFWTNALLSPSQISSALKLPSNMSSLFPIAQIHITPYFLDIEKGGTQIEIKLDICSYQGKPLFRELEFELQSGDYGQLEELSQHMSKYFSLSQLEEQKYSRLVRVLGVYSPKKQTTLALIKPDGVRRGLISHCIQKFETEGLVVRDLVQENLTLTQARELKEDISEDPIYSAVVDYLLEGPVAYMKIRGVNAINKVRLLCGNTNPVEAIPGTIRGDLAAGNMVYLRNLGQAVRNVIHSPKDEIAAKKELKILYGDEI